MEHIRSGPAETLAAELEAFAKDRDTHGKHERAAGARAAAAALLRGETVEFERVTYTPGGPSRRGSVFEGTRVEVVADLSAAVEGWRHNGRVDLAEEAAQAAAAVIQGADTVSAGFLTWRVTGATV